MNIDLIPVGDNPPESLNVIIEVPVGGEPVKYEFDKKSGALFVDRILHTPMRYPANYGFVPHTLSPDGDPLDALVVARSPFVPGCVVRARPIGVLNLEDEHGGDEKLICVPVDTTFPVLFGRRRAAGPALDRAPADRALLHPLQGSGVREVGAHRQLGRCRGRSPDRDRKRSAERSSKRLPASTSDCGGHGLAEVDGSERLRKNDELGTALHDLVAVAGRQEHGYVRMPIIE